MTLRDEIGPTWLEIDLDRLKYNMKNLRDYVDKKVKILAIVKANAYGHGAIECSQIFLENGADYLGVANFVEALELRRAGIKVPILIIGYTQDGELSNAVKNNITITIYSLEQAKLISDIAIENDKKCKIHIKINTGMSRLGFSAERENISVIHEISKLEGLEIEGIFSHFIQSDIENKSITREQFKKFIQFINLLEKKGIEIPIRHISNSGGTLDTPEYNLEMVRVGQLLYGIYPSEEVKREKLKIKLVSSLKSTILNYSIVKKGDYIDFNRGLIADLDMKIGILPLGLGDGYSNEINKLVDVKYKGKGVKLIGKPSIDETLVDISNVNNIERDDMVSIYSYEDQQMRAQLIVRIGRRIPRVYILDGRIKSIINYMV